MQTEPELKISKRGNKRWRLNDKLHREDGPAVEFASGGKVWFSNGKIHRTDGPAVELSNGDREWYLNNIEYDFDEWLKLTPLSSQEKVKLRFKYAK